MPSLPLLGVTSPASSYAPSDSCNTAAMSEDDPSFSLLHGGGRRRGPAREQLLLSTAHKGESVCAGLRAGMPTIKASKFCNSWHVCFASCFAPCRHCNVWASVIHVTQQH